ALGESNKQLNVLGWIMDVIQDEDFMQQLLVMNDDEIYQSIYTCDITPIYFRPTRNAYGILGGIPQSEFQHATIAKRVKETPNAT
ncbi:PTS sugar transporter subunit IIA, partial [Salmonella enterica subsp. enterica serovar Kentucky]|nr:PTS sugar transporter subunit IIA [Salmonella enterica subsp. enterica serovar Kentucky]